MIVSLIVAMDQKGGIGVQGKLPWKISSDLRRFKQLTTSHHVIMGRKTYESIGRPLSGRTNIVLSRNPAYQQEGCLVMHDLQAALDLARGHGENEAFILGGGEIFTWALPIADRIYLTRVTAVVEADTFFPNFNVAEWLVAEEISFPASEKDQFPYIYQVLERVKNT